MKKINKHIISFAFVYLLIIVIGISGCDGGSSGGGTGTTLPSTTNPVHTEFNQSIAYVSQTGQSSLCSVTVSETRGDEISFSRMATYRTFADAGNTGKTANFYYASPNLVSGRMFDTPGTLSNNIRDAVITNSSSIPPINARKLKAYERRTLSVQVMIGSSGQTKPASFTGIFIPYAEYYSWSQQGHTGVRYWVTYEGYDYKQNEAYNLHIPLEIRFPNLTTDPYSTGTGTGTDPYDPLG